MGLKGKIIGATVVAAAAYALKHSEASGKIASFAREKSSSAVRAMAEKALTDGNVTRHDVLLKIAETLEKEQSV